MRAKYFVEKAAECNTDDDAEKLLEAFKSVFLSTPQFCGFLTSNDKAYMEERSPYLSFEMNYVISNAYILEVEPIICDSRLRVNISMQFMEDGLGMGSRSWKTIDEEVIDGNSDISISELAKNAQEIALGFHAKIAEMSGLGFTSTTAMEAVEQVWPKTLLT